MMGIDARSISIEDNSRKITCRSQSNFDVFQYTNIIFRIPRFDNCSLYLEELKKIEVDFRNANTYLNEEELRKILETDLTLLEHASVLILLN